MDSKLTLLGLATRLAKESGQSKGFCENFLREFCNTLSLKIMEGEAVRVKHLGTFRAVPVQPRRSVDVSSGDNIEIAAHYKVSFTPAKDLARALNAPFSSFQTMPLPDDVPAESLGEAEPKGEPDAGQEADTDSHPDKTAVINTATPSDKPESSEAQSSKPKTKHRPACAPTTTVSGILDADPAPRATDTLHTDPGPKASGRGDFITGVIVGILACILTASIILLIECFFLIPPVQEHRHRIDLDKIDPSEHWDDLPAWRYPDRTYPDDPPSNKSNEEGDLPKTPSDTVAAAQDGAKDKEKVIMDTITLSRFLTTMAKDHYGNFNLWPYIYEENSAKLGHPDRIRPGTPVVIPPLSKYGVSADNPEDIKKAKTKGAAIYARYRR